MLSAIIWGLVQGLTEFLPISSSGHLVLVPAALSALGLELEEPTLAISAVLHLGTLLAVLVYFRGDVIRLVRFQPGSRHLWKLLVIGSLPVVVGLPLEGPLDRLQEEPSRVGLTLMGTAIILLVGTRVAKGGNKIEDARPGDALFVGVAQVLALVPGISRSGTTIVAGMLRGLAPGEAARFSFLLGIPAIAGGGLLSLLRISGEAGIDASLWVGMVVAAVSGYAAIAILLAALRRVGFLPFAIYTLVAGLAAFLFL